VLDGGAGDDTLQAGSVNDDLDGAAGFDQLRGDSGNDTLTNADGTLVNDTTADASTGPTATTASYLLTAGREARTLQPGTTGVGTVLARAPAPVTAGTGVGYLLRDRHSSVTALVDATAAVTNTYAYGDYGTPAGPDGQPAPAAVPAPGGRANPFQYNGAAPNSSMIDPTTGLLLLPARSYDPPQGRFTTRDTANVFNKYQAFSTNPIINVDPTGHFSLEDLLLDIGMAVVFAVAAFFTGGAALTAVPEVAAAAAVGEATAGAVVTTVATAVTAAASATGAVTSAVKAADEITDAVSGKHFLSPDQRNTLNTVQAVAGAVSAVSGLTAMGGTLIGIDQAAEATQDAADFIAEDSSGSSSDSESSFSDGERVYVKVTATQQWDPVSGRAVPVHPLDAIDASDSVTEGLSSDASEPQPLEQDPSDEISNQENVLEKTLGSNERTSTDEAIFDDNQAVKTSIKTSEAASEVSEVPPDPNGQSGTPPVQTAMDGNLKQVADVSSLKPATADLVSKLNADDQVLFMQNYDSDSWDDVSDVEDLDIPWKWSNS
jgi:RHS repeat-associated protein